MLCCNYGTGFLYWSRVSMVKRQNRYIRRICYGKVTFKFNITLRHVLIWYIYIHLRTAKSLISTPGFWFTTKTDFHTLVPVRLNSSSTIICQSQTCSLHKTQKNIHVLQINLKPKFCEKNSFWGLITLCLGTADFISITIYHTNTVPYIQ